MMGEYINIKKVILCEDGSLDSRKLCDALHTATTDFERNKNLISTDLSEFLPRIIVLSSSLDVSVRKAALPLYKSVKDLCSGRPLKTEKWWAKVEGTALPRLCQNLVEMMDLDDADWVQPWYISACLIMSADPKSINVLLRINEKAFRIAKRQVSMVPPAYEAWQLLMDLLSVCQNVLKSNKVVVLLLQPLISAMPSYANHQTLQTWMKLVEKIGCMSEERASLVAVPALNFMFKNDKEPMCLHFPKDCCRGLSTFASLKHVWRTCSDQILSVFLLCVSSGPPHQEVEELWHNLLVNVKRMSWKTDYTLKLISYLREILTKDQYKFEHGLRLLQMMVDSEGFSLQSVGPLMAEVNNDKVFLDLMSVGEFRQCAVKPLLLEMTFDNAHGIEVVLGGESEVLMCWFFLSGVFITLLEKMSPDGKKSKKNIEVMGSDILHLLLIIPLKETLWVSKLQQRWTKLINTIHKNFQCEDFFHEFLNMVKERLHEGVFEHSSVISVCNFLHPLEPSIAESILPVVTEVSKRLSSKEPKIVMDILHLMENSIGVAPKSDILKILTDIFKAASLFDQPYEHRIQTKVSKLQRRLIATKEKEDPEKFLNTSKEEETSPSQVRSTLMSNSNFLQRLAKASQKKKAVHRADLSSMFGVNKESENIRDENDTDETTAQAEEQVDDVQKQSKIKVVQETDEDDTARKAQEKDIEEIKSSRAQKDNRSLENSGNEEDSQPKLKKPGSVKTHSVALHHEDLAPAIEPPASKGKTSVEVVTTNFSSTPFAEVNRKESKEVETNKKEDKETKVNKKGNKKKKEPEIKKSKIQRRSTGGDTSSPKPKSFFEESNEAQDFIIIPPKPKNRLLTDHQKEVLGQRRVDIPALYQDLSQDTQTFDTNSSSHSLLSKEKSQLENSVKKTEEENQSKTEKIVDTSPVLNSDKENSLTELETGTGDEEVSSDSFVSNSKDGGKSSVKIRRSNRRSTCKYSYSPLDIKKTKVDSPTKPKEETPKTMEVSSKNGDTSLKLKKKGVKNLKSRNSLLNSSDESLNASKCNKNDLEGNFMAPIVLGKSQSSASIKEVPRTNKNSQSAVSPQDVDNSIPVVEIISETPDSSFSVEKTCSKTPSSNKVVCKPEPSPDVFGTFLSVQTSTESKSPQCVEESPKSPSPTEQIGETPHLPQESSESQPLTPVVEKSCSVVSNNEKETNRVENNKKTEATDLLESPKTALETDTSLIETESKEIELTSPRRKRKSRTPVFIPGSKVSPKRLRSHRLSLPNSKPNSSPNSITGKRFKKKTVNLSTPKESITPKSSVEDEPEVAIKQALYSEASKKVVDITNIITKTLDKGNVTPLQQKSDFVKVRQDTPVEVNQDSEVTSKEESILGDGDTVNVGKITPVANSSENDMSQSSELELSFIKSPSIKSKNLETQNSSWCETPVSTRKSNRVSKRKVGNSLSSINEKKVKPNGEKKVKPTEENKVKLTGEEKIQLTVEKVESTQEKVEPTEERVEPTEERVEPTEERVESTQEKVEPMEEKVETTEDKFEPTEEKVEPTEEKVKPSEEKNTEAEESKQVVKQKRGRKRKISNESSPKVSNNNLESWLLKGSKPKETKEHEEMIPKKEENEEIPESQISDDIKTMTDTKSKNEEEKPIVIDVLSLVGCLDDSDEIIGSSQEDTPVKSTVSLSMSSLTLEAKNSIEFEESLTVDLTSEEKSEAAEGAESEKEVEFILVRRGRKKFIGSPSLGRSAHMMKLAKAETPQFSPTRKPLAKTKFNFSPVPLPSWPKGHCEDWIACAPTPPERSPSLGILKRRAELTPKPSPSPPKKKRVSFLDPPVSKGLLYNTNGCVGQVQHSMVGPEDMEVSPSKILGPKGTVEEEPISVGVDLVVDADPKIGDRVPVPTVGETPSSEPCSSGEQQSFEDPPSFPQLVDCTCRVTELSAFVPSDFADQFLEDLSKLNIERVESLPTLSSTVIETLNLPSPKITSYYKILQDFCDHLKKTFEEETIKPKSSGPSNLSSEEPKTSQSTEETKVDKVLWLPKPKLPKSNASTQCETPPGQEVLSLAAVATKESTTQYDRVSNRDASLQCRRLSGCHVSVQCFKPAERETGVQCRVLPGCDASTQSERAELTSTWTQSEGARLTSTWTQSESPALTCTWTQSETPRRCHAATQFDSLVCSQQRMKMYLNSPQFYDVLAPLVDVNFFLQLFVRQQGTPSETKDIVKILLDKETKRIDPEDKIL